MDEVLAAAPQAHVYAGAADIPQIKAPRTLTPVTDGEEVFGLRIIATPGHTPGHISVLDPVGSLLVVGDAMAHQSVKKLAALTVAKAVFGHGGPLEQDASAAVATLARTL